jgi:hypothetical protein
LPFYLRHTRRSRQTIELATVIVTITVTVTVTFAVAAPGAATAKGPRAPARVKGGEGEAEVRLGVHRRLRVAALLGPCDDATEGGGRVRKRLGAEEGVPEVEERVHVARVVPEHPPEGARRAHVFARERERDPVVVHGLRWGRSDARCRRPRVLALELEQRGTDVARAEQGLEGAILVVGRGALGRRRRLQGR